ncbi:MAG: Rne/Rng family ribonuclease [Rickettsiaceae bacterium]|nr:Rne/Rng family ribonuclease [Rickettsiaceae bacterium]
MTKKIIIDANFPTETRVVLLDKKNNIENIEFSSSNKKQIKGNIYLAKITRVEPSLQAAFVDYGDDKSGFLPFSEINSSYYQIPSTDKEESSFIGGAIKSAEITSEDLEEKKGDNKFHNLIDSDDIDIKAIERMVDDKVQSDINIEAEEDEIESLSKESRSSNEKQYKIQEVIKKGQVLLVQATKEERGNKGASLTTYISLAGKYCVLMPNKPSHNGISRKISNNDERKRLKKIISDLNSSDQTSYSVIVRTAGVGHTTLEIKRDYDYLARLWNKIREATLKANAPSFIHQEDGILLQTIRDMFNNDVAEIIVQGTSSYNTCVKFMQDILPGQVKAVKEYKNKVPIYTKFGIEDQLIKLYQPVVHLPSGGYIVINPTEALISIDVNSGKATSERNIENMALKTNLEAAREVARQARLRDLSGLLVIDFIDLNESKNRKILERSLWEYFAKDKARIQTSAISSFGLLEMSRQRLRPSFLEMYSNMCSHCSGKGVVRSDEANSMLILRTIENEIYNSKFSAVNVYGSASSIIYLLNEKRLEITSIEKKYAIKLNFFIDRDATSDSYSMEKIKDSGKNKNVPMISEPALQDTSDIYNEANTESNHKGHKRRIDKVQNTNSERKAQNTADNKVMDNKVTPPKKAENSKESSPETKQIVEPDVSSTEVKPKRQNKNRKRIVKKPIQNKDTKKVEEKQAEQ